MIHSVIGHPFVEWSAGVNDPASASHARRCQRSSTSTKLRLGSEVGSDGDEDEDWGL